MNLPFQTRWIVLAAITLVIGGGMLFQSPSRGSADPIEAATPRYLSTDQMEVVRVYDGPTDLIGCRRNCWFAGSSASKIVVYRDVRNPQNAQTSWTLLGQHGTTWHEVMSGGGGSDLALRPDKVFQHSFATPIREGIRPVYRWGVLQDYVLMIGEASEDDIHRVEVVHDTGEVISNDVVNGTFISLAPADAICEVRARGFGGEVVERVTIDDDPMLRLQHEDHADVRCPSSNSN